MNRRSFLKGLATFAVVALAPFPTFQRQSLLKTLTWEYNELTRGKGSKSAPRYIYCGRQFYETLESEFQCLQRFTDTEVGPSWRSLRFKYLSVIPLGPGSWHEFV
jgi:hypothetical protein